LSQFPFVFYQDLRNKTFDWHKKLLSDITKPNAETFDIEKDYNSFQTFKFRLRRAAFLGNYQVLGKPFLEILLSWFQTNDNYFEQKEKIIASDTSTIKNDSLLLLEEKGKEELQNKEDNLRDFPVFVLGNYAEMIQRNGLVAYRILNAVNEIEDFKQSTQGRQFYNMLQIEAATVIDEFAKMINQDYGLAWQKLYKDIASEKLYDKTDRIVIFFNGKIKELNKTNKYSVVKDIFLTDDNWITENNPFVNYLWIKQLLYSDSIAKEPKIKIGFQEEINEIIVKMKGFFPDNEEVQAFFIVTDGKYKPYILKEEQGLLWDFNSEFDIDKQIRDLTKEIEQLEKKDTIDKKQIDKKKEDKEKLELERTTHKTQILIDFLNGIKCNTGIAFETTAEFIFDKEKKQWKNIYTNDVVKLDFLPQDTEWLYLIRISKLKEDKSGNCIFETQGLLGFYSQNNMHHYFPKQLLMLLRKDISAFIDKHHKNDEFSELIRQREKNKYVLRLNHGVKDYKSAIEEIVNKCNDTELKDELNTFYEYLIVKLDIIDKLNIEKTGKEEVSLQAIKDEFSNKYQKVLALNVADVEGLTKSDIPQLVKLNNFEDCSNLDEKYYFPEKSITDIVFELLNNIRKNVCSMNKWRITKDNPLKVDIAIINEKGNKYLSVTNNHVRDLDPQSKKGDIPHGIDLLRQMWSTHNLGKIITPDYPLREYSFTIKIQLKEIEK
jgi:hypothetical protein